MNSVYTLLIISRRPTATLWHVFLLYDGFKYFIVAIKLFMVVVVVVLMLAIATSMGCIYCTFGCGFIRYNECCWQQFTGFRSQFSTFCTSTTFEQASLHIKALWENRICCYIADKLTRSLLFKFHSSVSWTRWNLYIS